MHEEGAVSDWKTIDFFTDESLLEDPYPYFDDLRAECPVLPLPHVGVVAVTGYDELSEVYRDTDSFSSCNSVIGPYATFPVPLEGDDVSAIVARYRDQLPMHEHMVTMDPPDHTRERALLMRLITPKRLKDNEAFMWRLADHQLDELLAAGRCEFISAYAQPFAMLVVADLLGVPEEDHQRFIEGFGLSKTPGAVGAGAERDPGENPLAWLDELFAAYLEDRRRTPRQDVLTNLALATYPDGSTPDVTAVVRTATFLFDAGDDAERRGQSRSASVRVPARVPARPSQRAGAPRLRTRGALVSRWTAGARRSACQSRAHPRPHERHPPVRGAPRPARRAPIPV